MSVRRGSVPVCVPCGVRNSDLPGTLHGPAIALKFTPKTTPATGVGLNEVVWKDADGQDIECVICSYPMNKDSEANPWTGPGLFLTQACINGHVFHKGCLLTSMHRDPNLGCPLCKSPVLKEVAELLERNGAPAPVPPPRAVAPGGGGGLFGGGGGGLFGGGGGGGLFRGGGPPPAPAPAPAAGGGGGLFGGGGGGLFRGDGPGAGQSNFWSGPREVPQRVQEADRLRSERARAEHLREGANPFGMPEMTGVNGRFWLYGRAADNPTAEAIMQQVRGTSLLGSEQYFNDALWIARRELNIDPFSTNPIMWVTLYEYEFNGLSNDDGNMLIEHINDGSILSEEDGHPAIARGRFMKRFFQLLTTPCVQIEDMASWGRDLEDGTRRPTPRLALIAPHGWDMWADITRNERDRADEESL